MNSLLPFDIASPLAPLELGDLSIPRYGCLTVAEAIFVEGFFETGIRPTLPLMMVQESEAIATMHVQTVLATLLLISRHAPTWSLPDVMTQFSREQIVSASEFLLQEKQRWAEEAAPAQAEGETKVATNWARIWFRLQAAYPAVGWFREERFGNCPLSIVEGALETLNDRELHQAHTHALPIALLGVHLLATNGVKRPKMEWFDPYGRLLLRQQAKSEISKPVAETFLALCRESLVPGWAIGLVDIDSIRLAAE